MRTLLVVVCLYLISTLPTAAQHPYATMDSIMAERHSIPAHLAHEISSAARHHQIPYFIAFNLVKVESDFTPGAVSWAGAIGLTQVMPPTGWEHCRLTPHGLRHSRANLHCGFSYLRMLYLRLSSWQLALQSYNVGDARRRRAHLTGEPNGLGYARKILPRFN